MDVWRLARHRTSPSNSLIARTNVQRGLWDNCDWQPRNLILWHDQLVFQASFVWCGSSIDLGAARLHAPQCTAPGES